MNTFNTITPSITVLKNRIIKSDDEPENFLGFYHENSIETIELLFLEDKGCKIYGKTMEEIREAGAEFLAEIMHPDDIPRCINLLFEFAAKKNESEILTYSQRLKMLGEKEYATYFTCAKINIEKGVFQCVTTPMTNINEFYSEVNTILESSAYLETHLELYTSFSKREREVIEWVCKGLNVYEIAEKLFLSHHTIIKHKKNIYKKSKFDNKIKLIEFALNFNII